MEKKTTHIFRKEKGQIVVHGEVNLTDLEGGLRTQKKRNDVEGRRVEEDTWAEMKCI